MMNYIQLEDVLEDIKVYMGRVVHFLNPYGEYYGM